MIYVEVVGNTSQHRPQHGRIALDCCFTFVLSADTGWMEDVMWGRAHVGPGRVVAEPFV